MDTEGDKMSLFQTGAISDRELFGRFLDDRGVSDSPRLVCADCGESDVLEPW